MRGLTALVFGAALVQPLVAGEPVSVEDTVLHEAIAPEYPDLARAAGISGTVRIRVAVDDNGTPHGFTVLEGHNLLRQSALAVARLWSYEASKGPRAAEMLFVYVLVPVDACWQKTLPRFTPPNRVEIRARRVVPTCSDCPPPKPIKYEVCD